MFLDSLRFGVFFLRHKLPKIIDKFNYIDNNEEGNFRYFDIVIFINTARELGVGVDYLGYGVYELHYRGITRRIKADMTSDLDNAFTYWVCGHKYLTLEILKKYGIKAIPKSNIYTLSTVQKAREDFLNRKRPVVVKPCFGTSSGQGVTVKIKTLGDLNKAIFTALLYDSHYLIEDFIEGDNFRLLFLENNLLSAVKRIPASVQGNEVSTIRELINKENERRIKETNSLKLYPITFDGDLKQKLKNEHLSLNYIPKKEQIVYVKSISNFNAGGEAEEVSGKVNIDIVRDCNAIIDILKISFAGIDIITTDVAKPLLENGGVISEVNTAPGIDLHYLVRNQEERKDVAREVIKYMFEME